MKRVTVVGSGASAVHFARSALEAGWTVDMLDVGRHQVDAPLPDTDFIGLMSDLEQPQRYFLGPDYRGVLLPGGKGEYYGFPPHRDYIFEGMPQVAVKTRGFEPLFSFARGGLAEAWTGGCYPFNEAELVDYPIGYDDLGPYYGQVAERIGITGASDDLSRFYPTHENLRPPIELDEHGSRLVSRYNKKRGRLNEKHGAYLGRARTAVLTRDLGDRKACTKLGRCLWGCPRDALWTPAIEVRSLMKHERLNYRTGAFVSHFEYSDGGKIHHVVIETKEGRERLPVERLALGAGALSSTKIFLDSLHFRAGGRPEVGGLMDNRQILLPYMNLTMLGRRYEPRSYQYHQLALGFEAAAAKEYVHALITTLKTALVHPIIQSVPFDLKTSIDIFRDSHAALGLLNLNFWDDRRLDNKVVVEPGEGGRTRLLIDYRPRSDEPERLKQTISRVKRTLLALGCIVPPGMQHTRPMGASVHYACTLPMSKTSGPMKVTPSCQSYDFENLWLIDGATYPFLPAKNITFTLMANAARVAALEFA